MSEYAVLAAASAAIREILWQEFEIDPVIAPIVGSDAAIVFSNPTETARDSSNRLSLWLYQVCENEFTKNAPMQREGPATLRFPPLGLNLSYLLTPFATSGEADHLLLGKSMQVLYDNAIVLLSDAAGGVHEELHIVLARMTLEEITRVWESLREPYRLSVGYHVRVTRVDSLRARDGARVVDRQAAYTPDVAEAPA
jgi:hypothetical protein